MCLACEEQEYFFRLWCADFLARGEMPPGVTAEDLEAMGLPLPKPAGAGSGPVPGPGAAEAARARRHRSRVYPRSEIGEPKSAAADLGCVRLRQSGRMTE